MSSSDGNGGNGGHSESNNGSISGNRGITGQPNLASWSTQGHSQAVGSKAQHSNQKNNNRKKVNKNTRMEDGSPSDQADHKKAKKPKKATKRSKLYKAMNRKGGQPTPRVPKREAVKKVAPKKEPPPKSCTAVAQPVSINNPN